MERIYLDTQEEMPIVVNCVLEMKDKQYLDLYYAMKDSEEKPQVISDAEVTIRSGRKEYKFSWNGERWETDMRPSYDTKYFLEITTPGNISLTASTTFPKKLEIRNYSFFMMPPGLLGGDPSYLSPAHYFYITGSLEQPYNGEAFIWIDAETVYQSFYNSGRVKTEKLFSSHPGTDEFNIGCESWKDMSCISEFDSYIDAQYDQGATYDPYRAEKLRRAWEECKMSCGGLPAHKGFLRIHHPTNYSSDIPQSLLEFMGEQTGTEQYKRLFIISSDTDSSIKEFKYVRYYFHVLSQEYDAYLRDVVNKTYIHGDELNTFYSAEKVFSNIDGGLGIFGARHDADPFMYNLIP